MPTHVPAGCLDPEPEDDDDSCDVLTHVPEHCTKPDGDDDSCDVLTHVPEHCAKPDGDDDSCDVLTHVPEHCAKPDGEDGDDSDQGDDESFHASQLLEAGPDLPMTGGSYLLYAVPGGVLTMVAAVSLFGRRRNNG